VYLVGQLQLGEERDVARPFDGAEEQARCQFTHVLDTEHVRGGGAGDRGRLKAGRAAGYWVERAGPMKMWHEVVRFGADQQRDEATGSCGGRQTVDCRGCDADWSTGSCTTGRKHHVSSAEVACC